MIQRIKHVLMLIVNLTIVTVQMTIEQAMTLFRNECLANITYFVNTTPS